MSMDRTEAAIFGQGARVIDAAQVRRLILAARRAYDRQDELGLTDGETFDAWRKAQLWDAVREDSFRAVTQGDYAAAMARFAELAGAAKRADPAEADRERKAQLWDAVREDSFRAVTQGDYAAAMARFAELAGAARRADPAEADRERRARWKLERLLADPLVNGRFGGEAGARAYAGTLFARIHRTSYADANARQIWQVYFTVQARKRKPVHGGAGAR